MVHSILLILLIILPHYSSPLQLTRKMFLQTIPISTTLQSTQPALKTLPRPYKRHTRNEIKDILNTIEIYGIVHIESSIVSLLPIGLFPTRLYAEAVLSSTREKNPGSTFALADGVLGDALYLSSSKNIKINPNPSQIKAAGKILKTVPHDALPEFNALNGAVPLFFDYRVRVSDIDGDALVLFFSFDDLKSTYNRLSCDGIDGGCIGGGLDAGVTDLQTVARELEEGGPSDFSRIRIRGDVGTRRGGFEGVDFDLIDLMEGKRVETPIGIDEKGAKEGRGRAGTKQNKLDLFDFGLGGIV